MIEIRPATDSDKNQILERMAEVYNPAEAERAKRRWDWQWRDDPRLEKPGYQGVVAEWRGRIIANMSCLPAGLYINGQPVKAQWGVDALVHWGMTRQAIREQRRSGSAKAPDLSEGIAAAFLNHPAFGPGQFGKNFSDSMRTIAVRIGCKPKPGSGVWMRRVSYRHRLQRTLGRPLGALVAAGADLAIGRMPRPTLPVAVFDGDFDARFDRLWERARTEYPAITRRDAALLNWRYRRHPDISYRVLILERGVELRGYVIFSTFFHRDRFRGKIVDLLTALDDSEAADALLAGALRQLRTLGVERAESFASGPEEAAAFARHGFEPRLNKDGKELPMLTRFLPDIRIYATEGDGDGG
ncbi:MAG: GNAT family N-acetyltransferase [Verrucomicrobia bacterium]|nr:GNAT family N-acetyltransferase [Verrucomicrobiota bacterium]